MKRKLIAFLLVAALMASLCVTAAAGEENGELKPTANFVYDDVTYTVGLSLDSSGIVPGLNYIGEDGQPADLSNAATGQKTLALGIRTTDDNGQTISVGREIFQLVKSVSLTGGESLNAEAPGTHWMGWWEVVVSAPTESQKITLTVTANLDLDDDQIAETSVVIGVPLVWNIDTSSGEQDDQPASPNYSTFEYNGETYTVGLQEWANGDPMPMTFGKDYSGGGMRMTDEDFELEYVVCIKSGEQRSEVPAGAEIFRSIKSVSYRAEVVYTPESAGKVTLGDVRTVTRDTSTGGDPVATRAFSISVPGTSYFNMNITAVITMELSDEPVELTVTSNFQKPSEFVGFRTLRLDNYIDECDTAELQNIIEDRESLWRFYAEKSGCSVSDLAGWNALKVVLPAGTYGDLTFDISDQTITVEDEGSREYQINFNGSISLFGSDEDGGTTIGSLTYNGANTNGMSVVAKINFNRDKSSKNYGLLVTCEKSIENYYLCSTGVNNCTFNGYETAIISNGNGYANPDGCTFTNNETAISINCGDGVYVSSSISRCMFKNNKTAIYLKTLGKSRSPYSFRVTMCDFIGNEIEVNYQPAGTFYLFNNYYETGAGQLKRKATVIEGENTTIKQGVWRDQSFKSDITGYGIADEGVVVNNDGKTLTDEYLEEVTFDVIAADTENSETIGTWTFE